MSEGERRLAAIMYTDMVGYTALGQRNEYLSLALVEEQRKLLRPIFQRHSGREVKTIGDAFLVVFPSALDAIRCAYDIQRATREFDFSLPEDKRIHLRVGVHVGDIVESGGDVSGDAVNVASRIQPLAEDGGVCITRQVYDQVKNKFELPLASLGAKSLKNVSSLMEVFKVVMPWEKQVKPAMFTANAPTRAVGRILGTKPENLEGKSANGMGEPKNVAGEELGLDVGRDTRGKEFDIDPAVLTKHAIVLGATGSGKTVFCKAIIEEAALRGIPVLAIDPKGDISCLAISSKDFLFSPYSDVEADAMKRPREEYAQELQSLYAERTKEAGISPDKITQFIDTVAVRIFTPKSSAGIPVSISPKLDPPPQFSEWTREQPGTVSDLLDLSVNSLLNIVRPGRSGDEDQQAVSFLSSILEDQWTKGNEVDLGSLIDLVIRPPFEKVGNLPLDQIFPRKERVKLAADLNLFNSHPRLRAWTQGEPLDFDRLFDNSSKTPVNVIDLRGIQSQEERFFFVEMVLQQLYSWIIKQQGVQKLRFLLYFDEVVGFCPPVREPPSKKSLLLLIKQARAFGLGIILATQNPIDIDYKVISNANVRLIGRLATQRDVDRVKAGLELPEDSALTIQTLEKGQFLCQIFDPRSSGIVSPRWLMTYHRGPLKDEEINNLMASLQEGPPVEMEQPAPSPPEVNDGEGTEGAEPMESVFQTQAMPVAQQTSFAQPSEASRPPIAKEPAAQPQILGIAFALKADDVHSHVQRHKLGLFGQSEVIGDVRPAHRLLLELGIGLKTGLLSKKYETRYVLMDAETGKDVELGKKLVLRPGLERLLGLDSRDIDILRNLSDDSRRLSSASDLANRMKMSVDLARGSLQELERRRLAKSTQMGRVKAYQRIANLPTLDLKEVPQSLSPIESVENPPQQKLPLEAELRELVRGLREDYDLVSFRPFYYPLYKVDLALGNKNRTVWIDGVTGEETLL